MKKVKEIKLPISYLEKLCAVHKYYVKYPTIENLNFLLGYLDSVKTIIYYHKK